MIVLAGLMAGTLISGGLLFLLVTPSPAVQPIGPNGARLNGHNGQNGSKGTMTFRDALEKLGHGGRI